MVNIVSQKGTSTVIVISEDGEELKNILSANIVLVGGEVPKATLEVLNPILALDATAEYKIMDLDDYPVEYLELLATRVSNEIKLRDARKK